MSWTTEELYELLPAVYRLRDAKLGEPLRGLFAVLAEPARTVEDDIAELYENWFIETAAEWVVPYLGDLLGAKGVHDLRGSAFTQRARVANTLRYRRRKGTATMLEQLARDATGWNARALEMFELLGWTQHMHHIRPQLLQSPDLRDTNALELLNGPFERAAHTVDVRRIERDRGRYNIPNVAIFLWRLQSYYLQGSSARAVTDPADGRYRFHPVGIDAPLLNRPRTEEDPAQLAEEVNVPGMLRRRPLYDELEARRLDIVNERVSWGLSSSALDDLRADGMPDNVVDKLKPLADEVFGSAAMLLGAAGLLLTPAELTLYSPVILGRGLRRATATYFSTQPVLELRVQDAPNKPLLRVAPERIAICNLQDWRRPPISKSYRTDKGVVVAHPIRAAIDPVLGRIAFRAGDVPHAVVVSSAYGFSGDVGGGPYNRRLSVLPLLERAVDWQVGVSQELPAVAGEIFNSLRDALDAWENQPAGTHGIIAIMDSRTYAEELTGTERIRIKQGSRLLIVAAGWPLEKVSETETKRIAGHIEPDDRRPHILGNIDVRGATDGELLLDGLLIEGHVHVLGTSEADLRLLGLSNCTIVPGKGELRVNAKNDQLEIRLTRSICGRVDLSPTVTQLHASDSIIDHAVGAGIDAPGARITLSACTVIGRVIGKHLEAENCIFTDKVDIARRQSGCVRFCFVTTDSKTPRRFRCQPDLALLPLKNASAAKKKAVIGRIVPAFTSTQYGNPGYAQLAQTCPIEIQTGAEDGSEMGAFGFLQQPQRDANLRSSMGEYLRFGLEAGLIYVT